MSRLYGMQIAIKGHNLDKADEIHEAVNCIWPGDDWHDSRRWNAEDTDPEIGGYAENNLCGGESEEDFAIRVTEAVWKVNGGFCKVTINATYLEQLPYETYEADEDDYKRFLENQKE